MEARRNTEKTFGFFDSGGVVADVAQLVLAVYDSSGSEVFACGAAQNLLEPDLYLADSRVKVASVGNYIVTWSYGGAVVQTIQLTVTLDPSGGLVYGAAGDVVHVAVAGTPTVARILAADGTEFAAAVATAYDAVVGGYVLADLEIASEGDFFIVWSQDLGAGYAPVAMTSLSVYLPRGKVLAKFTFSDVTANNPLAIAAATVVVTPAGQPATLALRMVTNAQGECEGFLDPGDYVATLFKDGVVYASNNFTFNVQDPAALTDDALDPDNVYNFISSSLSVSDAEPASPLDLATIFGRFYSANSGKPLAGLSVTVQPVGYPDSLPGGMLVWDRPITCRTDGTGYFALRIAQGLTVRIDIQPLGITRVVAVPSGDDALNPVDIRTLLSETPDQFNISEGQVPSAPRRTL